MNKYDFLSYKKLSVDLNSEKSLKRFFQIFSDLSINDCAKLLKISARKLRKLKNKIGIIGNSIDYYGHSNYININDVFSKNYNNYEFLYRYRHVGIKKLSKLLKIGTVNLSLLYNRFKIDRKNYITKHPCRTKNWIEHHYVDLKLSIKECSYIANVSTNTFSEWVNEFDLNKTFRSKLFDKNKDDVYKVCNIINDL